MVLFGYLEHLEIFRKEIAILRYLGRILFLFFLSAPGNSYLTFLCLPVTSVTTEAEQHTRTVDVAATGEVFIL